MNNIQTGRGKLVSPNGEVLEARFVNGRQAYDDGRDDVGVADGSARPDIRIE